MNKSWDDVTKEELKQMYFDEELFDWQIAERYGVSKSKVRYKRNKLGITMKNKYLYDMIEHRTPHYFKLSAEAKELLLKRENIDALSKAITHYIFRNGPVESMHANNQLSEDDMKTLNKYMVNKVATLLTAIADNDWLELQCLFSIYKIYGTSWDKAEPEMDDIKNAFKLILRMNI